MFTIFFWILAVLISATLVQRFMLLAKLKVKAPAVYASLGITSAIGWNFFLPAIAFGRAGKGLDSGLRMRARIMFCTWSAEFLTLAVLLVLRIAN